MWSLVPRRTYLFFYTSGPGAAVASADFFLDSSCASGFTVIGISSVLTVNVASDDNSRTGRVDSGIMLGGINAAALMLSGGAKRGCTLPRCPDAWAGAGAGAWGGSGGSGVIPDEVEFTGEAGGGLELRGTGNERG